MNHPKVVVSEKEAETYTSDLIVFFVSGDGDKRPDCDKEIKACVKELFDLGDFKGKNEENILLYPTQYSHLKKISARRVLLIGLGTTKQEESAADIMERLRCAGGTIAGTAQKIKAYDLAVVLPRLDADVSFMGAEYVLEGILLGDYRFNKYKKEDKDNPAFSGIRKLTLHVRKRLNSIRKIVKQTQYAAEATHTARDMANEPGNKWTPEHFADYARELAEKSTLKCRILDKEQIVKAGMGGIVAVNQGSSTPAKVIIVEHVPTRYTQTVLLVGKGVTFDSGGVSIKPAAGMQEMKYDMCGGAAVLATMRAVAMERIKVRVVAVVPATDNMPGGSAVKPGDIIRHYNGTTSEVVNTDAEGRLILADALAYGIETYTPDCVIDLATLTGAVIVGLGHHRTGLMSNNDALASHLLQVGELCGEPLWRLPLDKEYAMQLESDVADIKNIGGKAGGAITAAAYLQKFVGETPWAHLDIAGTAWDFTKKTYIPKGPSGIGVRTLLAGIRDFGSVRLKS